MEPRPRALLLALAAPCLALASAGAHASDGAVEINQARAIAGGVTPGDGAGFPVTITQSGSYRLTSNLAAAIGAASMISISASGVTLDLGGFEISGNNLAAAGILANTIDVTLRNGAVRAIAGPGIQLGSRGRAEGVTLRDALGGGIECAADCLLRDLTLSSNGGFAVECGVRCAVLDSTMAFNTVGGISTGNDSVVEGNRVSGGGQMIVVSEGSLVARNTLRGGSQGVLATGPVIISGNSISGALGNAIEVSGQASIEGNAIASVGVTGILCGAGSVVRGNSVRGATDFALDVGATGTPVGYASNVFTANNGGDANPQVDGSATNLGGNICGEPVTCP